MTHINLQTKLTPQTRAFPAKLTGSLEVFSKKTNSMKAGLPRYESGIEHRLIRMLALEITQPQGSNNMSITIGSLFRRIVKVLKTQDNNPNSCLKNPKSDFYNPNYDINNPCSWINNQNSDINNASNNQYNKELRRNALRELLKLYLSDYLSAEQAEKLVTEYIP